MRLTNDEIHLLNRVSSLVETAHEDVREAEHSLEGLIKAAYVLGRIAELLDGQPGHVIRRAADGWNEVAAIFNQTSLRHGSNFRIREL
jgi:hypothetical protein